MSEDINSSELKIEQYKQLASVKMEIEWFKHNCWVLDKYKEIFKTDFFNSLENDLENENWKEIVKYLGAVVYFERRILGLNLSMDKDKETELRNNMEGLARCIETILNFLPQEEQIKTNNEINTYVTQNVTNMLPEQFEDSETENLTFEDFQNRSQDAAKAFAQIKQDYASVYFTKLSTLQANLNIEEWEHKFRQIDPLLHTLKAENEQTFKTQSVQLIATLKRAELLVNNLLDFYSSYNIEEIQQRLTNPSYN